MDVNNIRSIVTVVGLVLFLALLAYTWSRRRKAEYDAAAMLPFVGEAIAGEPAPQSASAQPARREGDAA